MAVMAADTYSHLVKVCAYMCAYSWYTPGMFEELSNPA